MRPNSLIARECLKKSVIASPQGAAIMAYPFRHCEARRAVAILAYPFRHCEARRAVAILVMRRRLLRPYSPRNDELFCHRESRRNVAILAYPFRHCEVCRAEAIRAYPFRHCEARRAEAILVMRRRLLRPYSPRNDELFCHREPAGRGDPGLSIPSLRGPQGRGNLGDAMKIASLRSQ